MNLPNLCIVDTNVPKTANLAICPDPSVPDACVQACVQAIKHITHGNGLLIMDCGNEIFDEYIKQLATKMEPEIGSRFMKWVITHGWDPDKCHRVPITKKSDGLSYKEFPKQSDLDRFDPSDRKFVAVANAYREKHEEEFTILQGTDSKWWGFQNALAKSNIKVCFLCKEYVKDKHDKKKGP